MDSWSHRGQKCRRIRLFQCLLVAFVFGECFTGIFGRRRDCPSASIASITNGTQLQFVSRRNQTKGEYCGASLETICFRDLEKGNCRTLLNLSLNLVAEGGRLVKNFEFGLLQTHPTAGKRVEIPCNVAGLAKNPHSSDKRRGVNFWLDYDCCSGSQSRHMYAAPLSVSYYKSISACDGQATVRLNKDVSSTVRTVSPISSENSTAESPLQLESKDLQSKAASLVGVVAAVVIAVVGAIVTIVLVYIVCVKCSDGRFFNYRTTSSTTEQDPLQPEKVNCRICHMEKANVVAPEEADSISYTTIDLAGLNNRDVIG
jgi:hypothetical protein